ncbi:hypothetical protein [Streptomyces sp.]|uniref:hypothetical protein n=1 Tax=Streptomyces sp. TaxID=1931 RepID=UPI002F415193
MTDRPARRGWTAYVEEVPAQVMAGMPPALSTAVTNFIVALAIEAGAAIDAGKQPPGDLVDYHGARYLLHVPGEPVLLEYVAYPALRELRIPRLVWFH